MITVLFLSSGRPDLTKRTLDTLTLLNPEFKKFNWICFENFQRTTDRLSEQNIHYYKYTLDANYIIDSRDNIGIGAATSFLAKCAETQNNEYTMYLQNDWECLQPKFINPCIEALKKYPTTFIKMSTKTGQMYNTFTKEPFKYIEKFAIDNYFFKVINNGHFSMNPFLIRTEHLPKIFPAKKERHAQEKFEKTSLFRLDMPADCAPFHHIGDGELRTPQWTP